MRSRPALIGIVLVLATSVFGLYNCASGSDSNTYYVNSLEGNDSNKGTSMSQAFQSLEKASKLELKPGDKVLFARGMSFDGSLEWTSLSGSKELPITVGSYQTKNSEASSAPVINASGHRNGILLVDCSHMYIHDLEITANGGGIDGKVKQRDMRCGVLLTTSQAGQYENIVLERLTIRDVFFEEEGFTRGKDEVRTCLTVFCLIATHSNW